jgi:hypothetical protein
MHTGNRILAPGMWRLEGSWSPVRVGDSRHIRALPSMGLAHKSSLRMVTYTTLYSRSWPPSAIVPKVRSLVVYDHVGRFLPYHDGRCVRVSPNHGGHNRRVDDTQAVKAIHFEFSIDYRQGIATHFTGTNRMEDRAGTPVAEIGSEVYGVTSLRPEQVSPGQWLAFVRGHWHIESKSHWVRAVTFDEDRSQVRSGNIPHVMAALRNTAIGVLRGPATPTLPRHAANWRLSRHRHWRSLGLHWKTE